MAARVLMVDDDPAILAGLRRSLRGAYSLVTANSGNEGLELQASALDDDDPFAVIISDMKMPGMDGAQFLAAARSVDPDAVLLILSGQADLNSMIDAVNEAKLFRFLTKPCDRVNLTQALDDALAQHQLIRAERDVLQRTLNGSITLLTELLAMASPHASQRTNRMRQLVTGVAGQLGLEDDWRLELAGMLSQIGCLALPSSLLHQVQCGADLSQDERRLYLGHPRAAEALLTNIPRLDQVARWIGAQPLSAEMPPAPNAGLAELAFSASAAFLCAYESTGNVGRALGRLQRSEHYDRRILEALLAASATLTPSEGVIRQISAAEVRPGMLLEQDIATNTGMVLVRKGEHVTATLAARLLNFADTVGIVEPITVLDHGA